MPGQLTIYAVRRRPLSSAEIEELAPDARVRPRDGGYEVVWDDFALAINEMPEDDLASHLQGFIGFLSAHGGAESLAARVSDVTQVIGFVLESDVVDQERFEDLALGLAELREGFLFTPAGIFETNGTPILPFEALAADYGDDGFDEDDELDDGFDEDDDDDDDEDEDDDDDDDEDDDWEPDPPSASRVARRALALCAVVLRAHIEVGESVDDPAELHARLVEWLRDNDLMRELEPAEAAFISAPRGRARRRDVIDASWRAEGVVVLAWALSVVELPPHDEMVDPAALADNLGFLADVPAPVLAAPVLRGDDELAWMQARLLGIHWRLRDFRLRPRAMDFREFAEESWFGGFDLDGIPVALGDLAIDGRPIAEADPDAIGRSASIAVERHQAINWLRGWDPVYSEVDTST